MNLSSAALLFFQFGPTLVQTIQVVLRLIHFDAGRFQARRIAGDGGIFQCGAPGLKILVRLGDALFDRFEFTNF